MTDVYHLTVDADLNVAKQSELELATIADSRVTVSIPCRAAV